MPLIKYLGCTIYLYREAELDYLFQYQRTYPMNATLLKYTSTHPQAMLLHKNTIKVTCKKNNRNKKPYKRLHIRPPSQMYNRWYFQHDLADIPLLQTIATATSFDRMFQNSTSVSSTIGFSSLDILAFRNHYYNKTSTTGYVALPNSLLFGAMQGKYRITDYDIKELIYLGNPEDLTDGTPIGQVPDRYYNTQTGTTTLEKKIKAVRQNWQLWGNPFDSHYTRTGKLITTNQTWEQILQWVGTSESKSLDPTKFTFKSDIAFHCRYNPFADKAQGNKLYMIDLKDIAHTTDWDFPAKDTLYTDLPLWLMTWGYLDYHRKCGEHSQIDTNYLAVIYSPYIQPNTHKYFVPLDQDFLEGRSPYRENEHVIPSDQQNWHPKLRFQVRTINTIASCGPGTVKLPPEISTECHLRYKFHFKIGGEPAPMSILTDPANQPKYITPDNMLQTTSLQNPSTPIEYILWKFDERRGQLTKTAAERIKRDYETETYAFPLAATAFPCPTTSHQEASTPETSDEEKEKMPIQEQLNQQRKQQKLLRHRINQLLKRLTPLE